MGGIFHTWVLDELNLEHHMQYRRGTGWDQCANIQLNWSECMEAYGRERGDIACRLFFEDLQECVHGTKRQLRYRRVKAERFRQVLDGERKYSELFMEARPCADSFPNMKVKS